MPPISKGVRLSCFINACRSHMSSTYLYHFHSRYSTHQPGITLPVSTKPGDPSNSKSSMSRTSPGIQVSFFANGKAMFCARRNFDNALALQCIYSCEFSHVFFGLRSSSTLTPAVLPTGPHVAVLVECQCVKVSCSHFDESRRCGSTCHVHFHPRSTVRGNFRGRSACTLSVFVQSCGCDSPFLIDARGVCTTACNKCRRCPIVRPCAWDGYQARSALVT
mmetsp:Transcript_584/g.4084  ORF Transcript_584/g.4084 Transcript_584/m.4084 type:complete len:220 (+) Transcript_584:2201-2860(+)